MATPGPCKRPIKIRNSQDTLRIGIVVGSLGELKEKGAPKFGLEPSNCRVQLQDGTEVLDEEYFSYIGEGTILIMSMLLYEYVVVRISLVTGHYLNTKYTRSRTLLPKSWIKKKHSKQ